MYYSLPPNINEITNWKMSNKELELLTFLETIESQELELDQAKILYFFAYHVFKVQQRLKCSICFELFNSPVAVPNCIHIFCEDCIQSYFEYSTAKQPPCPICKKTILRNGIRPETSLAKIVEFIRNALHGIHNVLGTFDKVTEFPSYSKVVEKMKGNENFKELLTKKNSIKIELLSKTPVRQNNNPREELFSTRSVETPANKRHNYNAQPAGQRSVDAKPKSSRINKDLFDVIKQSPAQNPLFKHNRLITNTRTYSVQKRNNQNKNTNIKYVDKLYEFEDNANKIDIIRWLNDSRNKFDLIPQSQENLADSQPPEFDMPSVSQRYPYKCVNTPPLTQINKQKLEQSRIRQKNESVIRLSRSNFAKNKCLNRRTRSLDVHVKRVEPKPRLKRHSITICELSDENIIIEQVNSEEEVICTGVLRNVKDKEKMAIVGLMEEECLKNIETEMQQKAIESKPSTSGLSTRKTMKSTNSSKRSKRIASKQTEDTNKRIKSSMDTSSGWTRMKEIKKTIRKTEKKPNKLTVVSRHNSMDNLASTAESGSKKSNTILKIPKQNQDKSKAPLKVIETAIIEKVSEDSITNSVANKSNEENNKPIAFDLDAMESYFSKNLSKLAPPSPEVSTKKNKSNNLAQLKRKSSSSTKNNTFNNSRNNKSRSPYQALKKQNVSLLESTSSVRKKEISKTESDRSNNSGRNIRGRKKLFSSSSTTEDDEGITNLQNEKSSSSVMANLNCKVKDKSNTKLKNDCNLELKQNELPTSIAVKENETETSKVNDNSKRSKRKKLSTSIRVSNEAIVEKKMPNTPDKSENDSSESNKEINKLSVSSILAKEVEMEISELNGNEMKNCAVHLIRDEKLISLPNKVQKEKPKPETAKERNLKQRDTNKQNTKDNELNTGSANKKSLQLKDNELQVNNERMELLHSKNDDLKVNPNKSGSAHRIEENLLVQPINDEVKQNKSNDDDLMFMKPTQSLNIKNHSRQATNDDAEDEIFTMPTQFIEIPNNIQTKPPQHENEFKTMLKKKIRSLSDILNTFEKNMVNRSSAADTMLSIRTILRDIKNSMGTDNSNEDLESSNELLHVPAVTRAVGVQTYNPNDASSLFSHSVTTQTNLLDNVQKNAAIQTDSLDQSRGFRISSTDMFNLQPVVETEVQTDMLSCPKCNYTFVNNALEISSDILARDVNTIKTLSDKYTLTGSFDDIDFETQEIIKGKQIGSTTSSVKTSRNTQKYSNVNKENRNESVPLQKPKVSNAPGKSQQASTAGAVSKDFAKNEAKKTFKRIRKPSSDSDSDSDIVLPKDIKRNKFIQDLSIQFVSGTSKEGSQLNGKGTQGDSLQLSEGSQDINYAEYLEKVLKKCDEDSPEQEAPQVAKFQKPAEPPAKRFKTQDMIKECEMIIKEACSHTIRIENTESFTNNVNSTRMQTIPEPSKLSLAALEEEFQHHFSGETKDTGASVNTLINISRDKVIKPFETELDKTENGKDKFSESLFASGDHFIKNETGSIKNNDKSMALVQTSTQINTENRKHCLDELINQFNDLNDSFEDDVNAEVASINELLENRDNTLTVMDDNIKEENASNSKNGRIIILQDIIIDEGKTLVETKSIKDDRKEAPVDLNMSIDGNLSSKSDDMFESDDDIVETTPQKDKPALEKSSFLSQAYFNLEEKMVLPPLVDESPDVISSLDPPAMTCLNTTFTPPPEFQDFDNDAVVDEENNEVIILTTNQTEKNEGHTEVIKHPQSLSSLTPDLLLPPSSQINVQLYKKPCISKNPYNHENERSFITSTPHSQIISMRSLNLSPIHDKEPNSRLNPILVAQQSKMNPLTIVKSKTPPPQRIHPLNTSTPKQKSILNYMRPTENLNTSFEHASQSVPVQELSQRSRKPCVACTRMSKEQLLAITALSSKKLISYSNSFSSSVTHMIVAVNEHQCVKDHTMKYVSAVASGIWILGFNWIEECLKQGRLLPEEPFEALDVSKVPSPKISRLNRISNPLFKGFVIHAAPPFMATTQKEVENVITLLGGEVVPRPDDLLTKNGKICLIITEARGSQDFELYEMWLETLKVVTVDLEWLSRSVGQYQRLSIRPFTLCSDESICELGYPSQLIVDVPDSFSHTTA